MNRRKVYTVTWPGYKKPTGLAMNCHMHGGELWYYDTNRGHMIPGKITEDGEDRFVFESAAGFMPGPWTFKVLTIEDFRRQTYKIVESGKIIAQTIKTTDDLHEWYRKTFGAEAGLNYPDVLDN